MFSKFYLPYSAVFNVCIITDGSRVVLGRHLSDGIGTGLPDASGTKNPWHGVRVGRKAATAIGPLVSVRRVSVVRLSDWRRDPVVRVQK